MRHHLAGAGFAALAVVLSLTPASANHAKLEFVSRQSVIEWQDTYRRKPEPMLLPAALKELSDTGALRDPEAAGFHVGFAAGVLGANRRLADQLIDQMLRDIPAGDNWLVVRAIAYSGLPSWKSLLARYADRMADRRVMIDEYMTGKLPPLDKIELDKNPTTSEKIRRVFGGKPDIAKMTFGNNPELLDTLWGQYFATGEYRPVWQLITVLPWSKDKNSTVRLNAGSAAKYTLASNAARYPDLLALLKEKAPYQDKAVKPFVDEVIRAAETADPALIKKQQLAALDELKKKGPGYQRDMKLWGYVGQGTIAVGCIVAASVSLTVLGLPCVIGGAVSSAAISYWSSN